MFEEESYSVVYLYSAVIEYIYFLIILIDDQGPNNLSNIAKHAKFFKKDVYTFIQIFKGPTLPEKVCQMLHSTTSVFEIKDNRLYLTNNHKPFLELIYKDLLISKVTDLILRGIFSIQDICHNLNLSSVIDIEEDILIDLLKHDPHFYFHSDSSVILVQFHGLVGFDNHAYQTTVQYFQSYLQNINLLTYNDIKLHSSFVPSCAVRNSLLMFCTLHVSTLFKCKNDKVSLHNKWKRKTHNQVLNIEKVSSDSSPIGILVQEMHGPTILCWQGEVISLGKSAGFIQCVVNFTNGYQGIFVIYFYKTALKYVCEVENMRHFLNVCDIVEFDAEFCGQTIRKDVVWQATRIKVVKHFLKENKLALNIDIYMQNINFNYRKMKPAMKECSEKNCLVKYITLQKDIPAETKCSIPEKDISNNNESSNSGGVNDNISESLCQTSTESHQVITFKSSEVLDNCSVKGAGKIEFDNQLSRTNCLDNNSIDILNKMKTFYSQYPSIGYVEMQDKLKYTSNGCIKQSIFEDINKTLNCIKEENFQNLVGDHPEAKNSGTLSNDNRPSINSDMHSSLVPNIFNDSSFILGEVTFMSTFNGVAHSLRNNKLHEIFFEKKNISFQNGSTKAIVEGTQVLLFIPYANLEESVLVATLVHPLTCEEKLVLQGNDLSANDFVVDYFFPKVTNTFSKNNYCCCGLLKSLSKCKQPDLSLKNCSETFSKCSQFIKQLQELFQIDDRTYRNLFSLINLVCAQNLGVSCLNLLKKRSFIFLSSLSWIRHYKNFGLKSMQKNINRCKGIAKKYNSLSKLQKGDCNNDLGSTIFNDNNIPKILLKPPSVEETYSRNNNSNIIETNKSNKKLATENSVIKQSQLKIVCDEKNSCNISATESSVLKQSCLEIACDKNSSSSSFASCLDDSFNESSDDVFYSCESDLDNSSVLCKHPHPENNYLCDIDNTQNSSNVINRIHNGVSKNTFTCTDSDELKEMKSSGIVRIQNKNDVRNYLKPKIFSLFKHRRIECKISLPSENVFCKSCHQLPIQVTAEISIVGKSILYFRTKCDGQNIMLAFPKSLVPIEKIHKMKLNAILKATIIPHTLMNFSRVLYIDLI